jgi:hypothetical protein
VFGPIRAVTIDDEPTHLLAITNGLSASGIPCMGFWYDRDTHGLKPAPAKDGFPFLRLVFMDLNLEELGGVPEAANLCGTVMDVLKQIVAKDGGPYLLVFWTLVGQKVDEVAKLIYERLDGIPFPIAVAGLSKSAFIGAGPKETEFKSALREFYSELSANIEKLAKAVNGVVAQDQNLLAVSMWEARASEAAARAVNEIHACAARDAKEPSKTAESIGKILAKIAVATAGKIAAIESPARALDDGMVDILTDQFGISVTEKEYQHAIDKAIGNAVKNEIEFSDNVSMSADLNTFFHVDTQVALAKAGERGVVMSATPFNKGDLGFTLSDLFHGEFVMPWETFPSEQQEEIRKLHEEFQKVAEFVLVELGADCDHAQDISRTRRYLVGLEVPVKFYKLLFFHQNWKLRSEALQLLGPWKIDGETKYLVVSCGRYWTWQKRKPHPSGKVKYRLRASIVSKLLHHYTVWSSRPGIVEFR